MSRKKQISELTHALQFGTPEEAESAMEQLFKLKDDSREAEAAIARYQDPVNRAMKRREAKLAEIHERRRRELAAEARGETYYPEDQPLIDDAEEYLSEDDRLNRAAQVAVARAVPDRMQDPAFVAELKRRTNRLIDSGRLDSDNAEDYAEAASKLNAVWTEREHQQEAAKRSSIIQGMAEARRKGVEG